MSHVVVVRKPPRRAHAWAPERGAPRLRAATDRPTLHLKSLGGGEVDRSVDAEAV